jgi:hypothetical protein
VFVAGQRVGSVRSADHDQLSGERAEPFDLLYALDGLAGVEGSQRRAVQQLVKRGLGDRPQVLTLTAREIQIQLAVHLRRAARLTAVRRPTRTRPGR